MSYLILSGIDGSDAGSDGVVNEVTLYVDHTLCPLDTVVILESIRLAHSWFKLERRAEDRGRRREGRGEVSLKSHSKHRELNLRDRP